VALLAFRPKFENEPLYKKIVSAFKFLKGVQSSNLCNCQLLGRSAGMEFFLPMGWGIFCSMKKSAKGPPWS
jgi:hypothetical protein